MIPFDILSNGLVQQPTSLVPTVDLVDLGGQVLSRELLIVLTQVDDKGLYIRSTLPPRMPVTTRILTCLVIGIPT